MWLNRFAGFGLGAATLTTVAAVNGNNGGDVLDPSFDLSYFMAEPVTPRSTLVKDKDDMKVKMEMFIMKIQVEPYLLHIQRENTEGCL